MSSYIAENLKDINQNIKVNANRSGRELSDIVLIAVTKTVDEDKINEAIECGVTDIGENKPQEIVRKFEHIRGNVRWHLIGSLQTNKVKYIIDKVDLIHSLDRESLAKEIDKRAKAAGKVMDCLVQINISHEDTKHGLDESEVENFIRMVSSTCPNIRIRGLMGMAPFVENPEESRIYFKKIKEISLKIENLNMQGVYMDYLSMGMSNDYEIALQEGSNMVRIGTAIFGKRNYAV